MVLKPFKLGHHKSRAGWVGREVYSLALPIRKNKLFIVLLAVVEPWVERESGVVNGDLMKTLAEWLRRNPKDNVQLDFIFHR